MIPIESVTEKNANCNYLAYYARTYIIVWMYEGYPISYANLSAFSTELNLSLNIKW